MPIYEYRCEACGHELEVMQRMKDPRLTTCPSCSEDKLVKLVSAAAFQLKGTGWYETDFKNKGKAPSDKSGGDSGGDSNSDSKKPAAKEDKPAPKKDTAPSSD